MLFQLLNSHFQFMPGFAAWVAYVLWVLGSLVFLLYRTREPTSMLAWLLAFWTLPSLSIPLYYLIGPRRLEDKTTIREAAKKVARSVGALPQLNAPSGFEEAQQTSAFVRVAMSADHRGERQMPPMQADELDLHVDGHTLLPALLDAIGKAQQHVHLEYYQWFDDAFGRVVRSALVVALERGVHVRVVIDALGSAEAGEKFWTPLVDAGGEVRFFNPLSSLRLHPGKINFRTHRKIVVVDGCVGFTGGMNLTEPNFPHDETTLLWRNTHVRLTGAPVAKLQTIFLDDWLYSVAERRSSRRQTKRRVRQLQSGREGVADLELPDDVDSWFDLSRASEHSETDKAEPSEVSTGAGRPWVQVVAAGPDEPVNDIHRLYFSAVNAARERLWIVTPYYVPDLAIETALFNAATSGVDVRLILPRKNDSSMVDAASRTFAADLCRAGGKVWMYEPVLNHSKTLLADVDFSIVGTANMDQRSFELNFEVVAAVWDHSFNARMAALYESDLEASSRMAFNEIERSLKERYWQNAMRLVSPLL